MYDCYYEVRCKVDEQENLMTLAEGVVSMDLFNGLFSLLRRSLYEYGILIRDFGMIIYLSLNVCSMFLSFSHLLHMPGAQGRFKIIITTT